MTLKIYNTLSHQKEEFKPLQDGQVSMYVCGPTVYHKAHVGHAMSVLVFDVIRRYLEYRGYRVRHAMNYTDVDDKIIQRANQLGKDPSTLAEDHILEFDQHMQDLNVLPPHIKPRATQTMKQIIEMVQALIDKGLAYETGGDVYFRIAKDEDYGKLSRRRLEEMQAGARIEVDERKEHPMDFVVWKAAKPGEPYWDSPWGKGRPGWHIECSAMNLAYLGEQIDIHGGGNDLIFPHHENEIAQTESLTGKPFARYWVHNGMLQLSGEKMSKSLGNLVTIEEFLGKHEGDVLRLLVLNSNYRNPLTYNEEVVLQTSKALERLRTALKPSPAGTAAPGPAAEEALCILEEQMRATKQGFIESMDDDFNTAGALGHLFELVRTINQARDAGVNAEQLGRSQSLLKELAGMLGLQLDRSSPRGKMEIAPFVDLLLEVRKELRRQKLWQFSDSIRDRLSELGIVLEDHKDGTNWHQV